MHIQPRAPPAYYLRPRIPILTYGLGRSCSGVGVLGIRISLLPCSSPRPTEPPWPHASLPKRTRGQISLRALRTKTARPLYPFPPSSIPSPDFHPYLGLRRQDDFLEFESHLLLAFASWHPCYHTRAVPVEQRAMIKDVPSSFTLSPSAWEGSARDGARALEAQE